MDLSTPRVIVGSWIAWGGYYYVKLDLDYDHEMDNPNLNDAGRNRLRASCLVWSGGKDKNKDTWDDNVMSWSN